MKHKIIGIGVGPTNLAINTLLFEEYSIEGYIFFEQKKAFTWHAGMLLPSANMQIPFLKDLVTTRNPCSHFTFINYLKQRNNLDDFIALRTLNATRLEFTNYLAWAAERLKEKIAYDSKVVSIKPIHKDNSVEELEITVESQGKHKRYYAENLVLGNGFKPYTPDNVELNDKSIFHSSSFLENIQANYPNLDQAYSFAIIGSGQSAAEITHYLLTTYRNAQITILSRGFIFHSLDENSFINSFYSSEANKKFYSLPDHAKQRFLNHLTLSNFSAVDSALITEISNINYKRKLQNLPMLETKHFSHVRSVKSISSQGKIDYYSDLTKQLESQIFDCVVLATGYDYNAVSIPILESLKDYFVLDTHGNYITGRNYEVITHDSFKAGVYLPNHFQNIHGFTQGTVSDLPTKAEKVLSKIFENKT